MGLSANDLAALRQEYAAGGIRKADLHVDPIVQFQLWLEEATRQQLLEPNAMVLATVDAEGQPWSRTVLLKGCDERGFTFFTNYEGAKGGHLLREPRCSLTFLWTALERQVHVVGIAAPTPRPETEEYFASRPVASQVGAWASRQSEVLSGREQLEAQFAEVKTRFEGGAIPCPPNWGGFRVRPTSIEFWQGRRSRLHDRLRYTPAEGGWKVERLSP